MRKGFKKFLTILLAVAMICTYSVTAFAAEGGENNAESTKLEIVNAINMFNPADTEIVNTQDGEVLRMATTSAKSAYSKVFVGSKEDADSAPEEQIIVPVKEATDVEGTYAYRFEIPMSKLDGLTTVSFYTKGWYERDFLIDKDAGKIYFFPTERTVKIFDAMTAEEVIKQAGELATPELVDQMIAAIQFQSRTENTDKYCAIAKALWDALSEEDQDKVKEGDYFGLDTGDAKQDNPLNQDNIGEKELLVVSFGTSFNDSRVATIGGVEKALQEAYPEYSVRRAFTAQIIINHIQSRDGETIDNMQQALDRAVENGVKELVVQPTHLMSGIEYDEMCEELAKYEDKIDTITIAEPLLNSDADKKAVADAIAEEAAKDAGFDSMEAAAEGKVAFVFMGHGTSHDAKETYTQMQKVYTDAGMNNVFIGTVEGNPESTSLPEVKKAVEAAGFTKVVLRPLMVVAGDHANNDMAANEEGSWYYGFANGGEMEVEGSDTPVDLGTGFGEENVRSQIAGLGQIKAVQDVYVEHTRNAINKSVLSKINTEVYVATQAEGTFLLPPATMTVNGYEAESYGYNDKVTDAVSVLDVAVAEAKAMYGDEFELDPTTYVNISDIGWIEDLFMLGSSVSFNVNGEMVATFVNETAVSDNAKVEFMFYSDTIGWSDLLVDVTEAERAKCTKTVELSFVGSNFKVEKVMDNRQVALIDEKTGEVAAIDGVVTDSEGKATVAFDKTGRYLVTLISDEDEPSFMPIYEVTVADHKSVKLAGKAATCISAGLTEGSKCSECGEVLIKQETAPATGKHDYSKTITKAATPTADGYTQKKCSTTGCTAAESKVTIAKPAKVTLEATKYAYNGKAKSPKVTVKDSKGKVIDSANYTVSYASNKNVGIATATVKFNGKKYSGEMKAKFQINPAKTSISGLTKGSKSFTVKWAKKTTQVTGYEIQYSTSSTFKKGTATKTVKVASAKTTKKTIKSLKAKKKYYVRVRTYKTVNKKPYYSAWSAKKTVTTK